MSRIVNWDLNFHHNYFNKKHPFNQSLCTNNNRTLF